MSPIRDTIIQVCSGLVVLAGGAACWNYIGLPTWVKAATGLFVVSSVLAGAVLVRLARPAPFSNPDVFTSSNVEVFYLALRTVNARLTVILAAIFLVIGALIVSLTYDPTGEATYHGLSVSSGLSAILGLGLTFIMIRLLSLVRGDFGFLDLQREIVLEARRAKSQDIASKVVVAPTAWKSPGGYGRAVGS